LSTKDCRFCSVCIDRNRMKALPTTGRKMKINLSKRNEAKITEMLNAIQPDIAEDKRICFLDLKLAAKEYGDVALTGFIFSNPVDSRIKVKITVSQSFYFRHRGGYENTDKQ